MIFPPAGFGRTMYRISRGRNRAPVIRRVNPKFTVES